MRMEYFKRLLSYDNNRFFVVHIKKLSFVSNRLMCEKLGNKMMADVQKEELFMPMFFDGSWAWLIDLIKG